MPTSPRETVLCRYHYDPLDRSIEWTPDKQTGIQRFYCKTRLATEIQGAAKLSVFLHDDQLLAQLRREVEKVDTSLLATDQQRSILNALDANQPHPFAYTPYGHRSPGNGLLSLLGFNGERPDPVTGHYHLGNGYRQFNPMLMRFNSPDSLSPFEKGGMNAYAYCQGNPVNRNDPTGHWVLPVVLGAVSFGLFFGGMAMIGVTGEKIDTGEAVGGTLLIIAGVVVGVGAFKSFKQTMNRRMPRSGPVAPRQRTRVQDTIPSNQNQINGADYSMYRNHSDGLFDRRSEEVIRELNVIQENRFSIDTELTQSSGLTARQPIRSKPFPTIHESLKLTDIRQRQ